MHTVALAGEENADRHGVEDVYTDANTKNGLDSPIIVLGEDDERLCLPRKDRNCNAEAGAAERAGPRDETEPRVPGEAVETICIE